MIFGQWSILDNNTWPILRGMTTILNIILIIIIIINTSLNYARRMNT